MVKYILGGIAVFFILVVGSCSLTKVNQGHVGVKVNNIGGGAGVEKQSLGVGWYFTPPGVSIFEYPIYTSNYAWTDSTACTGEGDERQCSGADESITFQDKNGLSIDADVSVAYRADPVKAPILFQKYRVNMDGILAGPLKNTVRNAIVSEASKMSVEEIYGSGKAALIERARQKSDAYLAPFGLRVEQLFWASNIRLPQNIQAQINARVANEQEALAAQAQVATREAEARAAVAVAEGKAKALTIEGEAIRANPQIGDLRAIEKWNGNMPVFMSGDKLPFNIPIGK